MISCNIDDCTGELLGEAMAKLMQAGARDCFFTPVYMKKCRPAYQLTLLCAADQEEQMTKLLFLHTSTIGVRKQTIARTVMERRIETVQTSFGAVEVKIASFEGIQKFAVEFESAKRVAEANNLPVAQVIAHTEATIKQW